MSAGTGMPASVVWHVAATSMRAEYVVAQPQPLPSCCEHTLGIRSDPNPQPVGGLHPGLGPLALPPGNCRVGPGPFEHNSRIRPSAQPYLNSHSEWS